MAKLCLKKVYKSFGDTKIIKGIDLDVAHGEFVVFVGPSGCGKSTLLRLIAGLEEVSEGDIYIDNALVNDCSPSERGIAMVFQSYALYPHMTVRENMKFGLEIAKAPKEQITKEVNNAAQILQLENLLERKPKQLSGGQRQRVAIGRAIVRDPKLFLFDEPLSNLDAKLRVQMRVEITQLHKKLGNTMIYVTHDQVEAMTMADKIVVLHDGIIEQVGSPTELYYAPQNKFVASFIGSPKMNFIKTKVITTTTNSITIKLPDDQTVSLSVDEHSIKAGDELELGIRPEHFLKDTDADLSLTMTIDMHEYLGSNSLYYCSLNGHSGITVMTDGNISEQDKVNIRTGIQLNNLHLFDKDGNALMFNLRKQQLNQMASAA